MPPPPAMTIEQNISYIKEKCGPNSKIKGDESVIICKLCDLGLLLIEISDREEYFEQLKTLSYAVLTPLPERETEQYQGNWKFASKRSQDTSLQRDEVERKGYLTTFLMDTIYWVIDSGDLPEEFLNGVFELTNKFVPGFSSPQFMEMVTESKGRTQEARDFYGKYSYAPPHHFPMLPDGGYHYLQGLRGFNLLSKKQRERGTTADAPPAKRARVALAGGGKKSRRRKKRNSKIKRKTLKRKTNRKKRTLKKSKRNLRNK